MTNQATEDEEPPEASFACEESQHWAERCHIRRWVEEGYPFAEGWPVGCYNPGSVYELILRTGDVMPARLDLSTQYRAEGLSWEAVDAASIERPSASIVIAWRRIR